MLNWCVVNFRHFEFKLICTLLCCLKVFAESVDFNILIQGSGGLKSDEGNLVCIYTTTGPGVYNQCKQCKE